MMKVYFLSLQKLLKLPLKTMLALVYCVNTQIQNYTVKEVYFYSYSTDSLSSLHIFVFFLFILMLDLSKAF
jgi:hypothetical protein